jgi:hypothetical protein
MPIPKALRHLYRGIAYRDWRAQLIERSGNKCELCAKRNGDIVETISPLQVLDVRMAWRRSPLHCWRDQNGKPIRRLTVVNLLRSRCRDGLARHLVVVCTAVRLGEEFLCQWCSLQRTKMLRQQHAKDTRLKAKDGNKPLLADAMEWGKAFEALAHEEGNP